MFSGFFKRHQPAPAGKTALLYGIGGAIGIALLAGLSFYSGHPLIMAPFGASAVLLFSVPASPLSQPANVIGGHLLATILALIMIQFLPNSWWAIGLSVGLAIGLMAWLRLTHPPAGADPIVIFASQPGFEFLVMPVLLGSILLVATAFFYHRLCKQRYPL